MSDKSYVRALRGLDKLKAVEHAPTRELLRGLYWVAQARDARAERKAKQLKLFSALPPQHWSEG